MNEQEIRAIVHSVLSKMSLNPPCEPNGSKLIPVEASGHHVHLDAATAEILFGPGFQLTKERDLSQPGQYLCRERVKLVTSSGHIDKVAVLGPLRPQTQVELSFSDARQLGISAPLNLSGDLRGAADVYILGPQGLAAAPGSAIVARNHLHLNPAEAEAFGVSDGKPVRIRINSARPLTFDGVTVRVDQDFALALHLDYDEANACGWQHGCQGQLVGKNPSHSNSGAEPSIKTNTPSAVTPPLLPAHTKLISEALARQLAQQAPGGRLELPPGIIITPAAKDVLHHFGITYLVRQT